jgi:hypothetical protein
VTENFAYEPGQRWPVEVLIQTEDPIDFGDFQDATEELLDRIQERIDCQEDRSEPDEDYLDKLREKLGDSNCEDWDEYCSNVSQPEVSLRKGGNYEQMNLAGIDGRKRMRRLIEKGRIFTPHQLGLLRRLEGQSAIGKKVVKVKRKRLKPRVRPALIFDCVRLDPKLSRRFDAESIKGFLDAHRRAYDRHDWSPYKEGFSSRVGQHERPDLTIYCLTVFFDSENSVTFATLVPTGDGLPDDHGLMDIASEEFHWDRSLVGGRTRARRMASN